MQKAAYRLAKYFSLVIEGESDPENPTEPKLLQLVQIQKLNPLLQKKVVLRKSKAKSKEK